MVTVGDFSSVMEQLGVYLSGQEIDHLRRLFDRSNSVLLSFPCLTILHVAGTQYIR